MSEQRAYQEECGLDFPNSCQPEPHDPKRREFLKDVLTVFHGTVAISISSACTSAFFASRDSFQTGFDSVMLRLHDPHGYFRGPFKYLDERRHEYVVPDDVINAVMRVYDIQARIGGLQPHGAFWDPRIGYDYLVLCRVLSADLPHYTSEEISFFASVFSLNNAIVIAESRLSAPIDDFINTLLHERMHRELFRLESAERDILMNAVHAFLDGRRGKHLMMDVRDHDANEALYENLDEFYCFFASGRINSQVMYDFGLEYPEAFLLFQRLEDKCHSLTKLD